MDASDRDLAEVVYVRVCPGLDREREALITPARKKRIVGQTCQPDSEPCQAV